MIRTDRAISHEDPSVLQGLAAHGGPALVLYGEYDIFGTSNQVVRDRLPKAVQVTLAGSGHLHWLQNESGYRDVLRSFYSTCFDSMGSEERHPATQG
jgi:pimeloyl-ACP methyl ester carboxylesterase